MIIDDYINELKIMQEKYGDKSLDPILNGGCINNPDVCFVFMNPTGKNIASSKSWKGLKSPWIGTKSVWDLFYKLNLLDKNIYDKIKSYKPSDWTIDFANLVYQSISNHKCFITNLAKCTQKDAKVVSDNIYKKYLPYLEKEIDTINPKVIILFGNQVSSIFLDKKISVSKVRKERFIKTINNKQYKCFSVFYPVGNGRFNIDKAIEDIKYILKEEV